MVPGSGPGTLRMTRTGSCLKDICELGLHDGHLIVPSKTYAKSAVTIIVIHSLIKVDFTLKIIQKTRERIEREQPNRVQCIYCRILSIRNPSKENMKTTCISSPWSTSSGYSPDITIDLAPCLLQDIPFRSPSWTLASLHASLKIRSTPNEFKLHHFWWVWVLTDWATFARLWSSSHRDLETLYSHTLVRVAGTCDYIIGQKHGKKDTNAYNASIALVIDN